jgi:hypothetical protein
MVYNGWPLKKVGCFVFGGFGGLHLMIYLGITSGTRTNIICHPSSNSFLEDILDDISHFALEALKRSI